MWVLCGYFSFVGHLYLIDVFLGGNQRTNIIWVHIRRKRKRTKRTTSANSSTTPYSTLYIIWEDLCIYVRNQQTYTSDNHNLSPKQ